MRDIIVYKCNVCDREIQLQRNIKTIETVGGCIITSNCRGRLYTKELIKTTSPFLTRTPEVDGLDDFYPRSKLFKFTQKYDKSTWFIKHNLETFPIISVYDSNKNIIPDSSFTLNTIDKNTLKIEFGTLTSGTAELYVREVSILRTDNETNIDIETIQVSTNLLTGTIAVLTRNPRTSLIEQKDDDGNIVMDDDDQPILVKASDTITLKLTSSTGQVQFSSVELTKTNNNSPWSGYTKVIIRNKVYYIGFIDFYSNGFNTSLISSGTSITIEASDQGVSHFLLSDSPFERTDIIKDKVLEVSKVNSSSGSLFFDNDEIFCDNASTNKVYPNLIIT